MSLCICLAACAWLPGCLAVYVDMCVCARARICVACMRLCVRLCVPVLPVRVSVYVSVRFCVHAYLYVCESVYPRCLRVCLSSSLSAS